MTRWIRFSISVLAIFLALAQGGLAATLNFDMPIVGNPVTVTVSIDDLSAGNGVAVHVSIPSGYGDLLGVFGNLTDESLAAQLSLNDTSGLITQWQFVANGVDRVGGGNNTLPVGAWDWGVRIVVAGVAGGPVTSASFELLAPGLTTAQILQAANQGFVLGVRLQSASSAKIGLPVGQTPTIDPPTISIATPSDGALLATSGVAVTGTATTPEGTLTVSVNGVPATLTGDSFSVTLALADGAHTLVATASGDGGIATDSVTISVDTAAPVVTIDTPADGALLAASPVTVTGTLADAGSIAQVLVEGVSASITGNGFSASVEITEGAHTLTVVATDAAGNVGSASVDVTLDTTAPAVSIDTPADGSATTEAQVSVAGSATDVNGIASVVVNGIVAALAGGSFEATVPLSTGPNTLTAIATDTAGNTGSASVQVTRNDAPSVSIDTPADGAFVNTASVSVTGSAPGADQVSVNGVAASLVGAAFSATVPLAEGANTLTATATNAFGSASASIVVTRDSLPPLVGITTPLDGSLTNSGLANVAGSVTDTSPIDTVLVNGVAATVESGLFSVVVPLSEGANVLTAAATDAAGNLGTASVSVTLDSLAPSIVIAEPADGTVTTQSSIDVSGSVTDASAITALTVNGASVALVGGTFATNVALTEGLNVITVAATDAAGNLGSVSVSVTRGDLPTVSISAPASGSLVGSSPVTVTGTATNATAVSVNGVSAVLTGTSFSADVPLAEGANTLRATASNSVGSTSASVTVTLDSLAPMVSITAPADGSTTAAAAIAVSGGVLDASPIASVDVNGVPVTLVGSGFDTTVPLALGVNTITVTATDALGHVGSASVSVTRGQGPSVTITSPADGSLFGGTPITVTGTATDAADVTVNGVLASFDGSNFSASADLSEGQNPITAVATNAFGTASDTVYVLFSTGVSSLVFGTISNADTGAPVVGATIEVVVGAETFLGTSDANGRYDVIDITPGFMTITYSADDFTPQGFTVPDGGGPGIIQIDVALVPFVNSVTLIGTVTSVLTNLPEADVEVTVFGAELTVKTDVDGVFVIDEFPLGAQSFRMRKAGFADRFVNVDIPVAAAGSTIELDFDYPDEVSEFTTLAIGTDGAGFVVNALSGEPLAGAEVQHETTIVVTDGAGRFLLPGLTAGQGIDVVATAADHEMQELAAFVVVNGEEQLGFTLQPTTTGFVGGTVTDAASGEPIDFATVQVQGSEILTAASEHDGSYGIVSVPAGVYTLEFSHPEYLPFSVSAVAVEDQIEATANAQLSKRPTTGGLTGLITDAQTGAPIEGASVSVSGVPANLTGPDGRYVLSGVPAGLVTLTIDATGFPVVQPTAAVHADPDPSTPRLSEADFALAADGTLPESTTELIIAADGGVVQTPDSRIAIALLPGGLSADARVTLRRLEIPETSPGEVLTTDPALGLGNVTAVGQGFALLIEAAIDGDPLPEITAPVTFLARYNGAEAQQAGIAEDTLFPYLFDGTNWTVPRMVPYFHVVDRINELVIVALSLDETETGAPIIAGLTTQRPILYAQTGDGGSPSPLSLEYAFQLASQLESLTEVEEKAISIDLLANFPEINPNALPLMIVHGWEPKSILTNSKLVDPRDPNGRYFKIIEDLVAGTNGVYRPVFLTYNTRMRITQSGEHLAFDVLGKFLQKKIAGLPAPGEPDSGGFDRVDAFGFSMGGLVARTYACSSRRHVQNMVSLAGPHHGGLQQLTTFVEILFFAARLKFRSLLFVDLRELLEEWSPGTADLLDYDDRTGEGNLTLWMINEFTKCATPRAKIGLIAGTAGGAVGQLVTGEAVNDLIVGRSSAWARRKSGHSVTALQGRIADVTDESFDHLNVGKDSQPISVFAKTKIFPSLTDWTVSRLVEPVKDVPATETEPRTVSATVAVEYNVPKKEITHVSLLLYVQDGNDVWRIAAGADPESLIPTEPKEITGNSMDVTNPDDKILEVTATLPEVVPGDPTTEVQSIQIAVFRATSESEPAPPEPEGNFGLPPP